MAKKRRDWKAKTYQGSVGTVKYAVYRGIRYAYLLVPSGVELYDTHFWKMDMLVNPEDKDLKFIGDDIPNSSVYRQKCSKLFYGDGSRISKDEE